MRAADEAVCIGPPHARESYLNVDALIEAAQATGADADPPRLRLPRRERRLRRGVRGGGNHLRRSRRRGDRANGRQGARATLARESDVPTVPGTTARARSTRRSGPRPSSATRSWSRQPRAEAAAGSGSRTERRTSSPTCSLEAAREAEAAFGDASLYLEKLLVDRASRRGAGARRQPRQRRPPLRARVLDAAAPTEDPRGGAVAGARLGRCARAIADAARPAGARGRLHERGDVEFLARRRRAASTSSR